MSNGGQEPRAGRLSGKRVLITGTGSGQGALAQRVFCQEGAIVAGCDMKDGLAEKNAEALKAEGFEAYGLTANLSGPGAGRALIDWATDALGGLDVLYNNAGGAQFAPFEEMTREVWDFSFRNSLDTVYEVTHAAWPYLKQNGGSIINVASVSGMLGDATLHQSALSAAKSGVIALTRQLAAEGGPHGIRVNCISPGFVVTPATDAHTSPELENYFIKLTFLQRLGLPEDIVPAAVYLASDESSFMTGQNLAVDGGWSGGTSIGLAGNA